MNRITILLISLVIISMPLYSQSYTTDQRSKVIHVVYDDSGSMIKDNGVYLDRWGQAKYAMEVFAVMLEKKDTMRVYYMSDFDTFHNGKVNASARINMSGSEPPDDRVAKVHNTVTEAWNTPYDAVAKAYEDLINTNADEKWLVVLTDGEFNLLNGKEVSNVDVDGFFSKYVNEGGIKIILLAMGDDAETIKADPGKGIYFEQAKNANEILGKITSICNQIFNRNRIKFTNEARYEFNFDIPMEELFVFAQGANIKVNGMKGSGTYSPSDIVNVRYSDVAATNYARDPVIKSTDLTGVIASFYNVNKGGYYLDIAGARTVDVYYKPAVNVDIKLLRNRREIRANDITEGKYRIQYGIVDEKGKFFESSLLGNVEYTATVQNNGNTIPIKFDDAVNLEQGELKVYVQARFLEFNTAENTLTRKVSAPLSLKERFQNWRKQHPVMFWSLVFLLLALLLYWIFWGRKKRFPKYMSKKPEIIVENDSGRRVDRHSGYCKITKKWAPFVPEEGVINAVADGRRLPALRVKAQKGDWMELINTSDFSAEKLNGVGFFINDQPLPEKSQRSKVISCSARIRSVYYDAGSATKYTCSFKKGNNQSKKRGK